MKYWQMYIMNPLFMAAAAVGGVLLLLFLWTFMSNAQFGLTLLAAKESNGFFPFMGVFFLYMIGFYFIMFFLAAIAAVIYVQATPPEKTSVPTK